MKSETQQDQVENAVVATLMYHRNSLLSSISPVLLQREELLKSEDTSFHPEIEIQFEALIRREIAERIALDMNFNAEQVFLIVETLNVKEFLGNFIPLSSSEEK